jgi:hypothetical protein
MNLYKNEFCHRGRRKNASNPTINPYLHGIEACLKNHKILAQKNYKILLITVSKKK